jgi:hypothetical protein
MVSLSNHAIAEVSAFRCLFTTSEAVPYDS